VIPLYQANLPDQTKVMLGPNGAPDKTWWLMLRAVWSRTGLGSGVPIQVDNELEAAGTNQATALVLNLDWNEVLTVPSGAGVSLLNLQPGQTQVVFNGDPANSLKVYPYSNWQIDALGANAPYTLAAGKTQYFGCWENTQYRTVQLG
jgi:hypothetical protein